jgi:hypothetical protein
MTKSVTLLLLLLAGAAIAAEPPPLGFAEGGVAIPAGGMGGFTLGWPGLVGKDGKIAAPITHQATGTRATLRYADGTALTIDAAGDHLDIATERIPATVAMLRMELIIGPALRNGGSWKIGDRGGDFPREKPANAFLFQGPGGPFSFGDLSGRRITVTLPPYSFQQLQDNLEWKWDCFCWWFQIPLDAGHLRSTIAIRRELEERTRVVLVDELGQDARRAFPGKCASVEELKRDVAGEAAYYASFTGGPALGTYGGLAGSQARLGLKATGFFHLEQHGGRYILVDPEGLAFFQLGMCCMGPGEDYTQVKGRESSFAWLPPLAGEFREAWHNPDFRAHDNFSFYIANVIRKYGAWDEQQRYGAMIDRLRAFGFNSCGAFSAYGAAAAARHWPTTPGLPLGRSSLPHIPGVRGVFDPFDAATAAKIDAEFARAVAPKADDPLIIGYFLENEQAFEDLPRAVPALDGKHACKRRLVADLQAAYPDIAAFAKAWELDAKDFAELADRPLAVKTAAARADVRRFTGALLDEYYALIRRAFDKVDRHHLLIGNRWQPGTANDEQLVRAAGKCMDVISINYYTTAIDRAFVDRIHEWSGGKPQFWSEFHFGSSAESGPPGRVDLPSQQARGLAYRNYVEGAAATGYVLGIQWFQLIDQPFTGRWFEGMNGEAFAIGLFSVADRPYRPMVAEMARTNREAVYAVWLDGRKPFVYDDPRFSVRAGAQATEAARATGPITLDGRGDDWPGCPPVRIGADRTVIGAAGEVEAVYRLCWDKDRLYVLATVGDPTPLANAQRGEELWNGDGIELFIGAEEPAAGGPLRPGDRRVLLGATPDGGRAHVVGAATQVPIALAAIPTVDGKGWVMEAAIPWSALGIVPQANQVLRFDIAIDEGPARGRIRQLAWSGGEHDATDRSGWGSLRLAP